LSDQDAKANRTKYWKVEFNILSKASCFGWTDPASPPLKRN